jgi:hypothetical protein
MTRKEVVSKISELESEIKYCQLSKKQMEFERSQDELDINQLYRNYQLKEKEAIKKIEQLRLKFS